MLTRPDPAMRGGKALGYDPAAGRGAILDALPCACAGSDLHDWGHGRSDIEVGLDLLSLQPCDLWAADLVISNLPYESQDAMLGHLLAITEGRQMVALLTRLEWASGARRRNVLHRHSRYLGQVTLTRRPRWIAGSSGSPRHNFAWQVWSESPTGRDPSIWFRP